MKLNKILSSALVVVMLFTSLVSLVPIKAEAAYSSSEHIGESLAGDAVYEYLQSVYTYQYANAEEMLKEEYIKGYLLPPVHFGSSSIGPEYSMYVNRYTGNLYYVNNWTGQILTTNPYNYPQVNSVSVFDMASQIVISYSETTKNTTEILYSAKDAAERAQISAEYITNGVRVNYTFGDTVARYLLPGRITAEKFEKILLVPMLNEFRDLMEKYCADEKYNGIDYDIFKAESYNPEKETQTKSVYYRGTINRFGVQNYIKDMWEIVRKKYNIVNGNLGSMDYIELKTIYNDLMQIYASGNSAYTVRNLAVYSEGSKNYTNLIKDYYSDSSSEISKTLEPIYEFYTESKLNTVKENSSIIFEKYVNKYAEAAANGEDWEKYSFTEMYEDEKYCGYVDQTEPKPVFRCSLEYTFNEDGSLSVRLPANSISFDETLYNLNSITVLKYFGAANGAKEGYIFFPDGSGMIFEYSDFYEPNAGPNGTLASTAVTADIYGEDNSYSPEVNPSKIVGAYREQISMPVFGVIGTESASSISSINAMGKDEVTNGYFAIIEEGASLAQLEFQTTGTGNFASAFCTYSPYPSDKYDLSDTISVSGADYYTIVSDAKFNGSYVTRYAMLTDKTVGDNIGGSYYEASYVGMANYYRDYLYNDGTLKALANIKENLPLYIEALGAMDIVDKFLSFPITKSISLTTFEDVEQMYNQLHDSAAVLEKYQQMADAETDEKKKAEYQAIADGYEEFVIDNINFRLTGFGHGGLSSSYPTKLRWARACGGKKAFNALLESAAAINAKGENFGIYPEYDFMYLSYKSAFDGVTNKNNVSKMIDNRYASKQVYDSITRQYVSYFSLVINPESLNDLYTKFLSKYSKYDIKSISVSTMGSDLNSNFDEELLVNRDDAQKYVSNVLSRMVNESGYDVMLNKGNVYALRYATHLLNVATDSSHLRYSSYAVPFIGMILHGSVNYAGTPINYSGTPAYDMLRAIESGSSLYYILCCENESYMKDDSILNDYYGVKYSAWYEDIIVRYKKLNDAIGDLQDYIISNHEIIIGERVIDSDEENENYILLMNEIISMLDVQLDDAVTTGYEYLESEGVRGVALAVKIDRSKLIAQFADIFDMSVDALESYVVSDKTFGELLTQIITEYENEYSYPSDKSEAPYSSTNTSGNYYEVSFDSLIYGIGDVLMDEMLKALREQLDKYVEECLGEIAEMNANLADGEKKNQLVLEIGREAIMDKFAEVTKLNSIALSNYEYRGMTFGDAVESIIDEYEEAYKKKGGYESQVKIFNDIDVDALFKYISEYSFMTDSSAFDDNYIYTDYTSDEGNIVLVTYEKNGHKVRFLLNYNIYTVEVKLGTEVYKLDKYEYIRIEG